MATPTYATVISQINAYIVANANNEITANILNPILKIITDFSNNSIGDLDNLTTSDKSNIVNSINSLKTDFNNLNNNGVQLISGYHDPNVTPPPSYNYADFYIQLDLIDDSPIQLWQWSGSEWNNYSDVYSKSEIDLLLSNIQPENGFIDYPRLLTVTQDFEIPLGKIAKQVFLNDSIQYPLTDNNSTEINTFTQSGQIVTLNQATEENNYITIYYT